MFSGKRVALSLSGIGALVVGVYSTALLLGACGSSLVCSASVYFGMPQAEVAYPHISMKTFDTTMNIGPTQGFGIAELHMVVQTVGLYLLLIGVLALILLELKELKLLKGRRRKVA